MDGYLLLRLLAQTLVFPWVIATHQPVDIPVSQCMIDVINPPAKTDLLSLVPFPPSQ